MMADDSRFLWAKAILDRVDREKAEKVCREVARTFDRERLDVATRLAILGSLLTAAITLESHNQSEMLLGVIEIVRMAISHGEGEK